MDLKEVDGRVWIYLAQDKGWWLVVGSLNTAVTVGSIKGRELLD